MPSARASSTRAEIVVVTADALGALPVMRQMNGYARPPADLQGLLPRREQARRQQAGTGVGVIKAAHACSGLRQRDQLVRVGIRAGRVVESGGKAPRSLLHRLANDRLHVGHLVLCRRSVVPADAPDTHGRVAEYVRHVDRDGAVELAYEVGDCQPVRWHRRVAIEAGIEPDVAVKLFLGLERSVRYAVYAYKLGRHALAHLGVVVRLAKHRQSGVRVQVYEPWTDDPPGSVDSAGSFEIGHVSTVERDSVALDTDGCVEARTGRSVDYKSVGY